MLMTKWELEVELLNSLTTNHYTSGTLNSNNMKKVEIKLLRSIIENPVFPHILSRGGVCRKIVVSNYFVRSWPECKE